MFSFQIYVSLAGLLSVGMAILFAYGIATVFDVIYGPIQSIMPFLLLGELVRMKHYVLFLIASFSVVLLSAITKWYVLPVMLSSIT